MKRRIVSLFIVACLLLSCTACKPVEELPTEPDIQELPTEPDIQELSAFDLTLSDEIKAQIDEAWIKSEYAKDSGSLPPGGRIWACIEDGYIYESGARYYGTFGDSVVWFICGIHKSSDDGKELILAGQRFYYDGLFRFYVYNNGSLCEMADAYESGLLTAEDLEVIAKRHEEYQQNAQNRYIDLDEEGRSVFDLYMPEQLKRRIEMDLVAAGYTQDPVWAEYKDGAVISDGIRFYGERGSALVLFVPGEGGEPLSMRIGHITIEHPTPGFLLRYSGGSFTDMYEEYVASNGRLVYGDEFLDQLVSRHNEFNQVLYPELYS